MNKNTSSHYPCVVTIAGTDPSGGAGIQADIKAISATGCYAASIITALVAQNTQGVQAIYDISPDFVAQQIDSVFSDLTVDAVKIGMLHHEKIIATVVTALEKIKPKFVVIDPVMVAKSGCELLKQNTVEFLKQHLFPCASLITPNLSEAEIILNEEIKSQQEMADAAKKMAHQYNINVLLKGGHLSSSTSSDVLYLKENQETVWYHAARINTKNTHGTGCSLSSAIASYTAQGFDLKNAVEHAKNYLTAAIAAATNLQLGRGNGPVHHFYFLDFSAGHSRVGGNPGVVPQLPGFPLARE